MVAAAISRIHKMRWIPKSQKVRRKTSPAIPALRWTVERYLRSNFPLPELATDKSNQSDVSSQLGRDDVTHLEDLSFGVLVKAQASFAQKSNKRKYEELTTASQTRILPGAIIEPLDETENYSKKRKSSGLSGRTSKHAPAIQSSRHAVSRRREVFDPSPSLKSRDPRFDPTVAASSSGAFAVDKANKHYSFLSSYQASEILDLKAQIKKAKDPEVAAALKRQVMSLDSKMRAADEKHREKEILKRHKEKQREAIKLGEKSRPYFLKKSDVKREALTERFNSMGKKARDKAMERKRKRVKGKEARGMPRIRREHNAVSS